MNWDALLLELERRAASPEALTTALVDCGVSATEFRTLPREARMAAFREQCERAKAPVQSRMRASGARIEDHPSCGQFRVTAPVATWRAWVAPEGWLRRLDGIIVVTGGTVRGA